jgi:hypothetical protein
MIVEVSGWDAKFTWETIGIYITLNGDMPVIERLAT